MMHGGVFLPGKKENSFLEWTLKRPKTPKRVVIPLAFGEEDRVEAMVEVGEKVLTGQKIARPQNDAAVAFHASLSGEVTRIGRFAHPVLGECESVEITASKNQSFSPLVGEERKNWQALPEELFLEIFREAGILDVSSTPVSLEQKVKQARKNKAQTLVVNLCESEPYVACRFALAMSQPLEILKGAEILRSVLGAERVVIVTETDKSQLAELLKSKIYFLKWKHFDVEIFPNRYPQDEETILNHEMKGRTKMFVDPVTVFAAYEAVVFQKPFYERSVTVGGECLIEPHSFWLPVGMLFDEAIRACKGFLREPGKVLMNAPMRGIALGQLEVPVVWDTGAILALSKETAPRVKAGPCVHCGRCVDFCPVEISPKRIALAYENGFSELAKDSGAEQCIECGVCAYVCPSKRPLSDWIKRTKKIFRK